MNKRDTLQSLITERDQFLQSFNTTIRQALERICPWLDNTTLEQFPLTPEQGDMLIGTDPFMRWTQNHSPLLHQAFLESDLAACRKNQSNNVAFELERPLGMREWIYPIRNLNDTLTYMWSGKFLPCRPDHGLLERYAKEFGIDADLLEEQLSLVPCLNASALKAHKRMLELLQLVLGKAIQTAPRAIEMQRMGSDAERIQALGSLSTGVAHHFNNLLSVILGYSSHLLNGIEGDENTRKALQEISEAAQRGRRLTQEILSFAGSEKESETICSVHAVLNHAISLMETQVSGRIRIMRDLTATKDEIWTTPSLLHQIIYSLLTNSMDGLSKGDTLCVRTLNPVDKGAEYISIELLDSNSTNTPDPMLLQKQRSKLHSMAEKMEGAALFSSEGESAQRAEVLLPLHQGRETTTIHEEQQSRPAEQLIWVVDDDPIFCEMCQRVLEDEGHAVVLLASGPALQEAWQQAHDRPDLLIIDFSMPDYSGLELCEWLKDKGSNAPVILVSGFSHNHPDIHAALQMRRTFFLQKPFPVPELTDVVAVALGATLIE